MTPQLVLAEHVQGTTIRVRFADGTDAAIDLLDELWGEVFEPLQDPALFRQFRLDRELNTIVWPTGADLAPEFLHARARAESGGTDGRSTAGG